MKNKVIKFTPSIHTGSRYVGRCFKCHCQFYTNNFWAMFCGRCGRLTNKPQGGNDED